jgi:hypothetical protein
VATRVHSNRNRHNRGDAQGGADLPGAGSKFACNQRFELIQPGKWSLEAELSRYESSHAFSSAIASIFTTAFARSRDGKNTAIQWLY